MDDWENGAAAACPSCGAPGMGGLDGCRAMLGRLGEREFSDPEYFRVHRLTVDAYSLQHPEQFMKSTKSAAAHLAGMCWSMERGRSVHLPLPLKAWVDGARKYIRVPPPPSGERGQITVVSVVEAVDAMDHERRVTAWAESAWEAWSAHWDQARVGPGSTRRLSAVESTDAPKPLWLLEEPISRYRGAHRSSG